MRKKTTVLFAALALVFASFILSGTGFAAQAADAQKTLTANGMGVHNGYDYELWKDSGTTSMTLKDAGSFSCSWSNINNALFRKGKKFDETKTHSQIGVMTVDYGCDYSPSGNSYLCVYGWTVSPLVEYYVVDSWGSWRPPGSGFKGTFSVDGGTYDIYETTRVNQPSVKGTATFQQYWSVRTIKRTSGTISLSRHFDKWESLNMPMGKMYEAALTVEGYQSSGSADVRSNILTIRENGTVVVNGGSFSGTPQTGQTITATANAESDGMRFTGWTVFPATLTLTPVPGNPLAVTFVMPAQNVTFTANYVDTYKEVSVNGGTFSGSRQTGQIITVTANEAGLGMRFSGWTTKPAALTLTPVSGEPLKSTFVMPEQDVTITAEYEIVNYEVSVTGGSYSGDPQYGSNVMLIADKAPSGKAFDRWEVVSKVDGGVITVTDNIFSMPAGDVEAVAVYIDKTGTGCAGGMAALLPAACLALLFYVRKRTG